MLPADLRSFAIEWAALRDPFEAYAAVWAEHASTLSKEELKANVTKAILYDGVIEYYQRIVDEADMIKMLSLQTSIGDIAIMYKDAYNIAKSTNNAGAMVSAASRLAALHRLDPLVDSQITRNESAAKPADADGADYDKVLDALADKLPE